MRYAVITGACGRASLTSKSFDHSAMLMAGSAQGKPIDPAQSNPLRCSSFPRPYLQSPIRLRCATPDQSPVTNPPSNQSRSSPSCRTTEARLLPPMTPSAGMVNASAIYLPPGCPPERPLKPPAASPGACPLSSLYVTFFVFSTVAPPRLLRDFACGSAYCGVQQRSACPASGGETPLP